MRRAFVERIAIAFPTAFFYRSVMKKPNTGNRDQGQESRRVAALLLTSVLDNRKPLDALLDTGDQSTPFNRLPPRDRRLTRAIVAAALRHHGEIEVILTRFIEKMPRGAGPLLAILRVAIAQILFMDIADHAAVSIAVTLTGRDPKTRRYKGMANAVLRRVIRERALFARTPEEAVRPHQAGECARCRPRPWTTDARPWPCWSQSG